MSYTELLVNFTGHNTEEFTITGFDQLSHQKLLGFLIFFTYFLVLLGSVTNICIITTDRRLHTPMYILICNLALVDIMYTTSASTTMISVLLAEVKTICYYSCISRMYIYHLGDIEECLALSLMALDRTIAVSSPLRYHSILTNPRIFLLIIASWLIGLGAAVMLAVQADSLPYCQPIIRYVFCDFPAMVRAACVDPEPYWMLGVILGIWLLGVQFTLILLSYMKLIYTVLRLPNTGRRVQLFNTCISHIIVVSSYFTPKIVTWLLTRIGVTLSLTERNAILIIATLLTFLINPTVYCLKTKEIRRRFIQILTRKATPK
ncbi:LOW QUALITY PROTEIN: olfactory receptor 10G4-like [Esox lucius]|uniref:LOW QUALITY PROTEIN: olfactory receptor 10G4-like n=1 Tax=Esox lucius TaxID=8010 RepID=UPI0014773E62|nr:LOW QUALITY PROTEIN: olfactory receptor 10G4-like [Esox lucius]